MNRKCLEHWIAVRCYFQHPPNFPAAPVVEAVSVGRMSDRGDKENVRLELSYLHQFSANTAASVVCNPAFASNPLYSRPPYPSAIPFELTEYAAIKMQLFMDSHVHSGLC